MPVKSNTNYNTSWVSDSSFFQIRIAYYNSNKEFISGENFSQNYIYSKYFTTPNNTAYCRINYSVVLQNAPVSRTNIQFEEGSTATTYEPYITPITKQLSLGEYEFAKIGNYVDTIEYDVDEDKVYKNEKIGKIVLDGSNDENWQTDYSTDYASNRFTCDNLSSLGVTTQTNFDYGYCNIGAITSEASYTNYLNVVKLRYINNQNRVDCMFDIADVSTLRTLLAQTPMEIYYQKLGGATLTEITTTLKDQIKALYNSHSFTGTTIIEINGQLPLIIKVRALKGE